MAKKEKKAAKAVAVKKEKKVMTPEEKAAKKAARMEAIKNRPAGQRTNSKQIDVIELANGTKVQNYAYPVVAKRVHIGLLTTSVVVNAEGEAISTSVTFIPGNLTVKAKKGHGSIVAPKAKGEVEEADEVEDTEDVEEAED